MKILNKLFLLVLCLSSASVWAMQAPRKKACYGLGRELTIDKHKVSEEHEKSIQEDNVQAVLQKYLPKDLANIVLEYGTEWKRIEHFRRYLEGVYKLLLLSDEKLASGDSEKSIKIWDLESKKCIKNLKGHTDGVVDLCSLPKNQLASASWDKTIKIWDLDTETCIQTLHGHQDRVWKICFLPDGTLASFSIDYTIKIWNLASGECLVTLPESYGPSMCVSSDDRFLISAGNAGVKVYDIKNNFKTIYRIKGNSKTICPLPDNKIAYSLLSKNETCSKNEIIIFDLNMGQKLNTFSCGFSYGSVINSILLISTNKLIYSHDSQVNILDLKNGEITKYFHEDTSINSMAILSDGSIAIGTSNGISIWGSDFVKLKSLEIKADKSGKKRTLEESEVQDV